MEVTNESVTLMAACLERTLSANQEERKSGEAYLHTIQANQNDPILLLAVIQADGTSGSISTVIQPVVRQAAAITFKNYIKLYWPQEDKISENDRNKIKESIVSLMLRSADGIQRQLSEAVSIIGKEDFPAKWPHLLDEMIGYMNASSGDFVIINGVLGTADSLFARYRHEFRSDELWSEINYVLGRFAQPFTALFQSLVNYSKVPLQSEPNQAKQTAKFIFSSLVSCVKIYHYLVYQDLPAFFEDHLKDWMTNLLDLLAVGASSNPLAALIEPDCTEEEPSSIETMKYEICDIIGMFAQKYDEEFSSYVKGFVQAIWAQLVATPTNGRYDLLVSGAINFLSTVAFRPQYSELFQAPEVLDSLCSKVVIPNIEFRDTDEELFEDNPEEFIRRDIEGSDADTRRRAACDLVRALSRHFEAKITAVFSQYIQAMLVKFQSNPTGEWRAKDAAIYLVTSMAAKTSTTRFGTSSVSELVPVVDFYKSHIKPDLERGLPNDLSQLPVLRADALKYLVTFRNQLPHSEVLLPSLELLVYHLRSPSVVVHTYAAHAIERFMMMKDPANETLPLVKPERDLAGNLSAVLLANFFGALQMAGSQENEYIMKAIMRTFSTLNAQVIPLLPEIMPRLIECVERVSKNPSKPFFNHYLFETIALTIGITASSTSGQQLNTQLGCIMPFESALFPIFQNILQQNVTDFLPYVFQLLAYMLELRSNAVKSTNSPDSSIPDPYMQLLPFLIMPALWETPSSCGPLSRLLVAYINHNTQQVISIPKMLEGLLGVFQKLISSKQTDHHGFNLLNNLLIICPQESLQTYIPQIFSLLFRRLTSAKTPKFVGCMLEFLSLFSILRGPAALLQTVDSLQARMFGMVIDRLYINEVQKVVGHSERRICIAGMIKILTETPEMSQGQGIYAQYWPRLLVVCVSLLEQPDCIVATEDGHFVEIDESVTLSSGGSASLIFAKPPPNPFAAQLPSDLKTHLTQAIGRMANSAPGQVPVLLNMVDDVAVKTKLQEYLNNHHHNKE